jgi:hypothetical protein
MVAHSTHHGRIEDPPAVALTSAVSDPKRSAIVVRGPARLRIQEGCDEPRSLHLQRERASIVSRGLTARFGPRQRKREADGRPARRVVGRPQAAAVRFDDRRQMVSPMPIPCGLVVEERLDTRARRPRTRFRRRIPSMRIASFPSRHERYLQQRTRRRQRHPSPRSRCGSVHEHLLHLDAIERDRRWRSGSRFVSIWTSLAAILSAISRQTSPIRRLTSSDDLSCCA